MPAELLRLQPRVRHRRDDSSPIDLTRPEDALLLKSFVWADQTARLERLDHAVETLRSEPPALERGDVVERLPDLLAERQLGALTVVFATAVIGYLGKEGHDRIVAALEEAGRQFPLAYLWTSTEARRARPLGPLGQAPSRWRGASARTRGLPASGSSGWSARVISSPSNPRLRLVRRLASRRQRDRTGLFSCEGEDLVEAALAAGPSQSISCWTPNAPLGVSPAVSSSSLASSQKSRPSVTRRERSACFVVTIFLGSMHGLTSCWTRSLKSCRPRQHRHASPGGGRTRAGVHRAVRRLRRSDGAEGARASSGAIFRVPTAEFDEAPGRRVALVAHGGKPLHELDLGEGTTFVLGAERDGLPGGDRRV